jgi:tRNA A-37 threonylcarbamoyl transferase component Bud32
VIATHIGQYRILRKIGAGGMGLVFLGEHMLLGRRAAIKTLLPTMAANHETVERFFNEARATSAISDPGVIQIFDFGYHVDGTAYIVMELLEGEALSERIARLGRLPLGDALRIARQIAGSLAAAHAHGVVHRDLKPDNIFLVSDAEAQGGERTKILDFGICKVGARTPMLTESGTMIGTPVYMSPEQCRGATDVDHRADIYAFGCLVFHVLTGRPPFVGDAAGELIVAHLEEEPPVPSSYVAELPCEVDALLLRCLAKSPHDRYPSVAELQHALGALHIARDGTELATASVLPAVPLGMGFHSVYDGNVTALAGGSWGATLAPATQRLRPQRGSQALQPRPRAQPRARPRARDDRDVVPPRLARARVVLAYGLIAGAVMGLCTATHVVAYGGAVRGDTDLAGAGAGPQAAHLISTASDPPAPVVIAPAASTADAASGARNAATVALDRARHPAPPVAASLDRPRSPREAPRSGAATATKPRPRRVLASARPPAASPPPPVEDLYDTR